MTATWKRQENRAKKAVGKTMRVCIQKRKFQYQPNIYCTGEIKTADYMGTDEEGKNVFRLVLIAGVDKMEHEVYVNHLPR